MEIIDFSVFSSKKRKKFFIRINSTNLLSRISNYYFMPFRGKYFSLSLSLNFPFIQYQLFWEFFASDILY